MDNHAIVIGGCDWARELSVLPGAHVAVLSETADLDGFYGRRAGLELRDTILVLSAGVVSRFVLLFRKGIEEATVGEQVLKTGTGGINIEASRVRIDPVADAGQLRVINRNPRQESGEQKWGLSKDKTDYPEVVKASGRWPPNVLIVHGSLCKQIGTKRVKNVGGVSSGGSAFGQNSGWNRHNNRATEIPRNRDENGLEAVPDWLCQPDCPVRLLDEQSGERPSTLTGRADPDQQHDLPRQHRRLPDNATSFTYQASLVYADTGGASRFFPQFKNDSELVDWIRRLITP